MQSPEEVISKASNEKDAIQNNIREVADWFHDEGGLIEKSKAVERINDELDIVDPHVDIASDIVSSLAGDHVDPVQHVSNSDGQFVGVIEYAEHDGYYSFTEYHDISGEHTRAVCGTCIESSTRSSEPFTRHTGEFGNEPHGNVDELHTILSDHIEEEHDSTSEVKTGATLASGTTISGNASLHAGNLNTSYTFTAEQTFSGGIDLSGGNIASVGGTTDASSGAIRLANSTSIEARNGTDDGDIVISQVQTDNDIVYGSGSRIHILGASNRIRADSDISMNGNYIEKVGGSTDASSGAIRLANDKQIAWRNSANGNDVSLYVDDNDKFRFEGDSSIVGTLNSFGLDLNGGNLARIGGATDAESGAIRLANGSTINARNSGSSDDFGISFTSNDTISMDNANVEIPNGGLTLSGTLSSSSISTDELSGGLTGGSTIDTLDGLGLEFVNNTLKTTNTPGAVAEIENDELSGTAFDAKKIIFRKEFFLTYQNITDKIEVGLDNVVYDRQSNTIGDGTPNGDFSSVSTSQVDNTDYNEVVQNLSGSGTIDIDLSQGNSVEISATGDVTITFSNVSSTPSGNSLLVYFEDGDGSGPYAISWPSSVVWNQGSTVGEIPASSDIEASLITGDGGSEWRGRKSGESFA